MDLKHPAYDWAEDALTPEQEDEQADPDNPVCPDCRSADSLTKSEDTNYTWTCQDCEIDFSITEAGEYVFAGMDDDTFNNPNPGICPVCGVRLEHTGDIDITMPHLDGTRAVTMQTYTCFANKHILYVEYAPLEEE